MRKSRKDEHIEQYLRTKNHGDPLFCDVYAEPLSFPEIRFEEVDLSADFMGRKTGFPLLINAMTGGTEMTEGINQDLALLAARFGLAMEVGSQRIALEDEEARETFTVVRDVIGDKAPVIANLGCGASLLEIEEAIAMLNAEGIGLHANAAQELTMQEGDRDFTGILANLKKAVDAYGDKVIIKEVGFGMSVQTASALAKIGAKNIDVSGAGGTSFIEIEDLRQLNQDFSEFYDWGVPTAKSILNVRRANPDAFIIASGGIKTAMDMIKSLILGADYCAISGELLRYLLMGGYDYAAEYVERLMNNFRTAMVLLGCTTVSQLKNVPYRLTGRLKELEQ